MAWESGPSVKLPGFTAAADLSTAQYKWVKITGAGVVNLCTAVTDIPCGVLQNAPRSGEAAEITALGVSKIVSSAGLAVNALIGTTTGSLAVAKTVGTDVTHYVGGKVIVASANANELAVATINCLAPSRAV